MPPLPNGELRPATEIRQEKAMLEAVDVEDAVSGAAAAAEQQGATGLVVGEAVGRAIARGPERGCRYR